jgi:hypothetical protein
LSITAGCAIIGSLLIFNLTSILEWFALLPILGGVFFFVLLSRSTESH